jgi:beta-lactamase superfamily II metal-dependent hydrolase
MELFTLCVGQGNFAVLRGEDEAIIIDTHIPTQGERYGEILRKCLPTLVRDRKVTGLVLTGFDRDHADPCGVSLILGRYLPDWVMYPTYFKGTRTADEVFAAINSVERKRLGTRCQIDRVSIRLDKMSGRILQGLSYEWDFEVFSPHPSEMSSSNNSSLVVQVRPKPGRSGFRYLITGDTENDRWEVINEVFGDQIESDVLAAPHHGSWNGINEDTLALINPKVVLVSAGIDNRYEHPHDEAWEMYEASGARVFTTSEGDSLLTSKSWWGGINTSVWQSLEMAG